MKRLNFLEKLNWYWLILAFLGGIGVGFAIGIWVYFDLKEARFPW